MRIPVSVFLVLFTVSGFAGLIYQSIWSHYLKLFLGHAAYAQTLVLGIFMGGMALGSWAASRYSTRLKSLLIGYAIAEFFIGILAIAFHSIFVAVTDWSFATAIPSIGSEPGISLFKWTCAALLILPASILLGTTFPLMSGGIMRAYGDHGGRYLPMLYFTNSFGAAVGVLASGFFLIERLGLPGTIFTAGLLNIVLALVVWGFTKQVVSTNASDPGTKSEADWSSARAARISQLMYLGAFITGAASFMFEIAWIRMLSMAIGASTHSFEVMLSSFILGIALGGLALTLIGHRIQNYARALSIVLLVKCVAALTAVMSYSYLLDLVQWLYQGLSRTENGYSLFVLGSYSVASLMMIPTAFCAGMTLPLATRALLANRSGEQAVGQIYAANTLGAIAGTFLATHVGMEYLGVKGITGVGALMEFLLALLILFSLKERLHFVLKSSVAVVFLLLVGYVSVFRLDELKMASGVYRFGQFMTDSSTKLRFHRDGKTASISVLETATGLDIRTNGKTDAAIRTVERDKVSTSDEHTMELAAILPFLHRPDAKLIANIGFGSGLTTHTVLGNPGVARVDSIEIEAAMLEGAKLFLPLNERAYTDPRSNLIVEDAKTYFSSQGRKYDIIISEPSNPWISGVSTLFSREFYSRIKHHLSDGGVLVQWIQLYDTKPYILASILKALGQEFGDYTIYFAGPGDAVIIASRSTLPATLTDPFLIPAWKSSLNRLGYQQLSEFQLLKVGSRKSLEPLINSFAIRPNSDFYPVVDLNAPRERFIGSSAISDFGGLATSFVPLVSVVDSIRLPQIADLALASKNRGGQSSAASFARAYVALDIFEALGKDVQAVNLSTPERIREHIALVQLGMKSCTKAQASLWLDAFDTLLRITVSGINRSESVALIQQAKNAACMRHITEDKELAARFGLLAALVQVNLEGMRQYAEEIIQFEQARSGTKTDYYPLAVQSALAASLLSNDYSAGSNLLEKLKSDPVLKGSFSTLLLVSHIEFAILRRQ